MQIFGLHIKVALRCNVALVNMADRPPLARHIGSIMHIARLQGIRTALAPIPRTRDSFLFSQRRIRAATRARFAVAVVHLMPSVALRVYSRISDHSGANLHNYVKMKL